MGRHVLGHYWNEVGIVTDRDVLQVRASPSAALSSYELLYLFDRVTVEEVMTRHPLMVTPEMPLLIAARLLHDRRIGGLPVVEGGAVVGIITETDLFGAFIEMFEPHKNVRAPTSSLVSYFTSGPDWPSRPWTALGPSTAGNKRFPG